MSLGMQQEVSQSRPLKNPDKIKFSNVLPIAQPGKTNLVKINPQNGSNFAYGGSSVIRFQINDNAFMDTDHSSLNLKIKNVSGATARLSTSGYSVIRRWAVYGPDGAILSNCDRFNVLMSALTDYSVGNDYRDSTGNQLMGLAKSSYRVDAYGRAIVSRVQESDRIPEQGEIQVSLPLQGALNLDRYLPLRSIASPGLLLEITLENPQIAMRSGVFDNDDQDGNDDDAALNSLARASLNYQITDAYLSCQMVHFNSAFNQTFDEIVMGGNGIELAYHRWTNYQRNVTDAAGTVTFNHRAHSVKSIVSMFLPNIYHTEFAENVYGNHARGDGTRAFSPNNSFSVQWRIGSNVIPPQALSTPEDLYRETLHALGDTANSTESGSGVDKASYARAVADASNFRVCTSSADEVCTQFVFGADLEAFNDGSESGWDTATRGESIEQTVVTTGMTAGYTLHSFICDDAVLRVSPDGMVSLSV